MATAKEEEKDDPVEKLSLKTETLALSDQVVEPKPLIRQESVDAVFPQQPPNPSLNRMAVDVMGPDLVAAELKSLPAIVADIMSPDRKELHAAQVGKIRRLLSVETNPPLDEVIATGVIPFLIAFLARDGEPQLQFEACWSLTNIASGSAKQASVVVGATPLLAGLIKNTNTDLAEQAVWCIGNLAGDSPRMRDLVLAHNCLRPLLELLASGTARLSTLRNGVWTLSNFCRGKPPPDFSIVRDALPVLAQLIYSTDDEILTDAAWALSYLSDGDNVKIQSLIQAGVCRRLVELLTHRSAAVVTPILRTVGNLVTGDDMQTQVVLNCGVLPVIRSLLSSPKKGIRKEALWTISNITAGNRDQIQAVIDAGLVPPIISLMASGEFDIKKEAAWALSNLASGGTPQQIRYVVSQGALPNFVANLSSPERHLLCVSLEALDNILRVYAPALNELPKKDIPSSPEADDAKVLIASLTALGLVPRLEALVDNESSDVSDKATGILERYLQGSNTEDGGEDLPPRMPPRMPPAPTGFSFGGGITTPPPAFGFSFEQSEQPAQQGLGLGVGRGGRGGGRGGRGIGLGRGRGGRGRGRGGGGRGRGRGGGRGAVASAQPTQQPALSVTPPDSPGATEANAEAQEQSDSDDDERPANA